MLSVYKIKPKFQQLLLPILKFLHRFGVTPNALTYAAIVLSLLTGILVWYHPFGWSLMVVPIALLFRMALNALDGMMAKHYSLQSKKGELLNELGDVVSDLFMFFPFYFFDEPNKLITLAFLFLGIINEFAGVLAKSVTGIRQYDGPMGKSDRALFVGVICLILYFYPPFAHYLDFCFLGAIVLLVLSTFIRLNKCLKN